MFRRNLSKTIEDPLQLYLSGVSAWNSRLASESLLDFSSCDFSILEDKGLDFTGFKIPSGCLLCFSNVKFGKGVYDFSGLNVQTSRLEFDGASFENADEVLFRDTKFGVLGASFCKSKFGNGVVDFSHASFQGGNVSFNQSRFEGDAIFNNMKFHLSKVDFTDCEFSGNVSFVGTKFHRGRFDFQNVTVEGEHFNFCENDLEDCDSIFEFSKFRCNNATFVSTWFRGKKTSFRNCEFDECNVYLNSIYSKGVFIFEPARVVGVNAIDMSSSLFDGVLSISGISVPEVIDLRHSKLQCPIDLDKTKICHRSEVVDLKVIRRISQVSAIFERFFSWFFIFKQAVSPDSSTCYRRLKKLAKEAEDHKSALDFFAKEMRSDYWRGITGVRLFFFFLYDLFSDYGRSVLRPLLCLIFSFLIFGGGYWSLSDQPDVSFVSGLTLSMGHTIPFYPASRDAREDALVTLFGSAQQISDCVHVFAIIQDVVSSILIFLIALALRNLYRT
ncbi:pentapeptide repeat-containing protein [Hahella sp. HN01]|uniref:pentapeptide repeat-containing protein n=1 Tax=Hahella sp. HN01 TaxID=2847262 RepID=UPI001C1ED88F|nr:hypothetical protein [Hahella sp. HN01]MBU6954519.1 hypothetical protein [Hahella sp. HN01]